MDKNLSMDTGQIILIGSGAVTFLLIAIAYVLGSLPLLINMIFLGMMVLIVPYSVYRFFRFKKVKAYEEEFPNFLRDLSENQRADLSLIQAMHAAAKSDYGLLNGADWPTVASAPG